jgi:hypothetical protein
MKVITNYKDFLTSIKEGLITTHNIYRYVDNLHLQLKSFNIENKIEIIDKYSYFITIFNPKCLLDSDAQSSLLSTNNLLGYFPSYVFLYKKNTQNSFNFDLKRILEQIAKLDILKIKMKFEGKYEDGLYKNNIVIPKLCYHLSPIDNESKIQKTGLIPKSKNKKSIHPERIYLFDDYTDYNILLANLKMHDMKSFGYSRLYNLYEITMNDKIILHTDPSFTDGYYTYDNISPKDIKILLNNI